MGFTSDVAPDASPVELNAAVGWAPEASRSFDVTTRTGTSLPPTPSPTAGSMACLHSTDVSRWMRPTHQVWPPFEVELWHETTLVSRGRGSDTLGGPIEAIACLLHLPGVDGIRAGDIVTTGTLTTAQPIRPGQNLATHNFGPAPHYRA